MHTILTLLGHYKYGGENLCTGEKIVVVAAHPDDEVIGMGGHLKYIEQKTIIHITDGAPRNMVDAQSLGFVDRETYARVRREELLSVLKSIGVTGDNAYSLGFVDQESARHMVEITKGLYELLITIRPDYIITHAYEGGHPDHDAAALSVWAACRLLKLSGCVTPRVIEFTSYYNNNGQMATGTFLPHPKLIPEVAVLTGEQKRMKKMMIAKYRTQEKILRAFETDRERFRWAPAYNFLKPPHDGKLWYEIFKLGMTANQWCTCALRTMESLKVMGKK